MRACGDVCVVRSVNASSWEVGAGVFGGAGAHGGCGVEEANRGVRKRVVKEGVPVAETGKRGERRNFTVTRSKVCVRQRVALLGVRGWDVDSFRSARGHMGDVE